MNEKREGGGIHKDTKNILRRASGNLSERTGFECLASNVNVAGPGRGLKSIIWYIQPREPNGLLILKCSVIDAIGADMAMNRRARAARGTNLALSGVVWPPASLPRFYTDDRWAAGNIWRCSIVTWGYDFRRGDTRRARRPY